MLLALLALLLPLQDAPAPAAAAGAPASREHRIGAEDVLRVTVYGHPDLGVGVAVEPDGTFKFPLIGRVEAAGLLPRELEAAITARLADGYVRNPQVTVVVEVARSQRVFVMGEVTRPGWCAVSECANVVEALARTGPLLETAGAEAVVLRPRAGGAGAEEAIRVDLDRLQGGGPSRDVALRPGDTVLVPRAGQVFVSGEVKEPGAYGVRPGTTVRQAVSLAGGFARRAARDRIRILRPAAGGTTQELKAGLEDEVRAGDTVVVERRAGLF